MNCSVEIEQNIRPRSRHKRGGVETGQDGSNKKRALKKGTRERKNKEEEEQREGKWKGRNGSLSNYIKMINKSKQRKKERGFVI